MNRFAKYAVVFALSGTMFAQVKTSSDNQLDELQKQYQLEATKVELNYNKLRDLQEFQDYLQGLKNLEEISKKAQSLASKPVPAPAKNETKPKR